MPEALTHVPQMLLADYFAINADPEDVRMAEEQLETEIMHSGQFVCDHDPLTIRCKARYIVAERMIRVRDERPSGQ